MEIPFLSAARGKKEAVLVFDVGSGSVAAGVVLLGGPVARVAAVKRITLPEEARDDAQKISGLSAAFAKSGAAVLDNYARSAHFKTYKAPTRGFANVHAPWVHALTSEGIEIFKTPTRITREMLQTAGKKRTGEGPVLLPGHMPLETAILRVELNGYPTSEPVGKTVSSVRVLVLRSTILEALHRALAREAEKLLPGRDTVFSAAVSNASRVIRHALADERDYVFIDMASEASSASLLRAGAIQSLGTVPVGWRTLVREAATKRKSTITETLSLVRMIADGTCSTEGCAEVGESVAAAEGAYMKAFGELFSTPLASKQLPSTLFIAVHPGLAPWAKNFFGRIDFGQFTVTGRPFDVNFISSRMLADTVTYTSGAAPDAGVSVAGALLHMKASR